MAETAQETYPELKQKYDHLVRQMASLNDAAQKLDALYQGALSEITLLRAKLIAAQKAVDIQKEVVRNYLTQENTAAQGVYAEVAALHAENEELKRRVRSLEAGA